MRWNDAGNEKNLRKTIFIICFCCITILWDAMQTNWIIWIAISAILFNMKKRMDWTKKMFCCCNCWWWWCCCWCCRCFYFIFCVVIFFFRSHYCLHFITINYPARVNGNSSYLYNVILKICITRLVDYFSVWFLIFFPFICFSCFHSHTKSLAHSLLLYVPYSSAAAHPPACPPSLSLFLYLSHLLLFHFGLLNSISYGSRFSQRHIDYN